MDVAARAALLHETADHHGSFEAVAPPHDWWDWYAAYMLARQGGRRRTRPPRRPAATWPRSSTSSSHPPDAAPAPARLRPAPSALEERGIAQIRTAASQAPAASTVADAR